MTTIRSIPRPLVRANQWFIVAAVGLAWILHSPWVLVAPLTTGSIGLIAGFNPVVEAGKRFLRKPASEYVPEDATQQQFNQVIAVTCLALSVASFTAGWAWLGYLFSALVAVAALVAILGFCIGCFLRFQWLQFRHRQQIRH